MAELTVKNLHDTDSFINLRTEWEQLLTESASSSVFLTWEWLFSWWKNYGAGKELWLVTVRRDKKLVGLLPLMKETRKKLGVTLSTIVNLGTPQSDVGGFLFNPGDDDIPIAILEYLKKHQKGWDILELNEISLRDPAFPFIASAFDPKQYSRIDEVNAHFFIELEDSWDKFGQRLSKKFRHNLRRALKLAEEIGPVKITRLQGRDVNEKSLDIITEINRHANYPKLYNSLSEQAFLKELAVSMAEKKWFSIYLLFVNNEPVAYEYGFVHENRFEDWRSGFDTRFPANISIGKLLAMQVVQKCIEEKQREIDFLRGDESYKQEWVPSKRDFVNIRLFNNSKPQAMGAFLWLQKIKPLLRRNEE
jgi:CelD/BcsL family acetyltransferase involved in cellulose biosynthesis